MRFDLAATIEIGDRPRHASKGIPPSRGAADRLHRLQQKTAGGFGHACMLIKCRPTQLPIGHITLSCMLLRLGPNNVIARLARRQP